jgi:branched-chain amino acid transport system ATP-binding protein
MLKVNSINAFYGNIQVLWDISFTVANNEIVAMVGANGAGKSTVLKVVSGLLHPVAGSVSFEDQRIEKFSPQQILSLGIVHIPEGRRLFPDMTVKENLELGAYLPQAWKRRKETMEGVFQTFPILKDRAKQMARTLSGGEQQMLTIGRGLMTRPKLCMFDETSYGLSPIMALTVLNTMKTLREKGLTILIIEQNVKRALEIADRAYVVENGRIALEGSSQTVAENPHVKVAYLGL